MHSKGSNPIIMIQISISKIQIALINHRVKISTFIQSQISFEIYREILKDQFDRTVIWQKPKVYMLVGADFPMFYGREMDV